MASPSTPRTALARASSRCPLQSAARQGRGDSLRRQGSPVQRLTGIDVAEPGHHALVEKRRFERRAAARKGRPQIFGIEVVAEGLGTKRAEERMARCRRGVDDVHQAEAAGIGVDDAGAVIEQEGHVIVARRFGGRTRRGELVIDPRPASLAGRMAGGR